MYHALSNHIVASEHSQLQLDVPHPHFFGVLNLCCLLPLVLLLSNSIGPGAALGPNFQVTHGLTPQGPKRAKKPPGMLPKTISN